MGPDLEPSHSRRLILQYLLGEQQPYAVHYRILRGSAAQRTDRQFGSEPELDKGRTVFHVDLEFKQCNIMQRRRLCGERHVRLDDGDTRSDVYLLDHLYRQQRFDHSEYDSDRRSHGAGRRLTPREVIALLPG
jgi:hypothetical protein